MSTLFIILFLVFLICLILGLIYPRIFKGLFKLFKKEVNRKKTSLVFGIAAIVCLIFIGIFSTGTLQLDKINTPTNQKVITVSGKGAFKNSIVKISLNGEVAKELKADNNGNFSTSVELKEGSNKIKASSTNDKSKTESSPEIEIVYDITPSVLVLSQAKFETDSDKAEISGETENNSTLTLWVGDKEISKTIAKDGKFKFNIKDLKKGENKFIVKVTDEAGNVGEQKEVVIKRVLSADELKQQADAKAKADADAVAKVKAEADAAEKARIEAEAKARANAPAEYKSALSQASSYANTMHMSKQGVYDQLVSEYGGQFSAAAAQYAIDNVKADWNANALDKAKDYQDTMHLSPAAIHDQLTSQYGEKFTQVEADYAIQHLND